MGTDVGCRVHEATKRRKNTPRPACLVLCLMCPAVTQLRLPSHGSARNIQLLSSVPAGAEDKPQVHLRHRRALDGRGRRLVFEVHDRGQDVVQRLQACKGGVDQLGLRLPAKAPCTVNCTPHTQHLCAEAPVYLPLTNYCGPFPW